MLVNQNNINIDLMNIVRNNPTPTTTPLPPITDLSAFISHPFKVPTTHQDQPKIPSADLTAMDPYSATQDSFLAYASDPDSAPNTAGIQELPVETGSRFAVPKAVRPFTAQGTPAALDSGTGDTDFLT